MSAGSHHWKCQPASRTDKVSGYRELIDRFRWYVENGVRIALLLDPDDSAIRDFRPGAEPIVLRAGDVLDLGEVLPGSMLDVDALFDVLTEG